MPRERLEKSITEDEHLVTMEQFKNCSKLGRKLGMINLSKDSVGLNYAFTAIVVDLYQSLHGKNPDDSVMFVRKKPDYSATVYYDELLDQYEIILTREKDGRQMGNYNASD
jgi:hypothetical protein